MRIFARSLCLLGLAGSLLSVGSIATKAAELVIVEYSRCPACIRFNATVGRSYAASPQGRIAPLHRIKLGQEKKIPSYLSNKVIKGTPTFILIDGGREIGRFDGFRSPKRFWARLDSLLVRLH